MQYLNKENPSTSVLVGLSSTTRFFAVSGVKDFDESYLVW